MNSVCKLFLARHPKDENNIGVQTSIEDPQNCVQTLVGDVHLDDLEALPGAAACVGDWSSLPPTSWSSIYAKFQSLKDHAKDKGAGEIASGVTLEEFVVEDNALEHS